ncbi:MAG: hypothetical protein IT305_14785 [Chloroflexi bacterium]|nr:hypothetical protein [Chloroflexota bacterium]
MLLHQADGARIGKGDVHVDKGAEDAVEAPRTEETDARKIDDGKDNFTSGCLWPTMSPSECRDYLDDDA